MPQRKVSRDPFSLLKGFISYIQNLKEEIALSGSLKGLLAANRFMIWYLGFAFLLLWMYLKGYWGYFSIPEQSLGDLGSILGHFLLRQPVAGLIGLIILLQLWSLIYTFIFTPLLKRFRYRILNQEIEGEFEETLNHVENILRQKDSNIWALAGQIKSSLDLVIEAAEDTERSRYLAESVLEESLKRLYSDADMEVHVVPRTEEGIGMLPDNLKWLGMKALKERRVEANCKYIVELIESELPDELDSIVILYSGKGQLSDSDIAMISLVWNDIRKDITILIEIDKESRESN